MAEHKSRIRIALVGAGIFARETHLPALLRLGDEFEVVAVYSRQRANAAALAESLPGAATLYTDVDELLADPAIEAVDLVLPIQHQPAVIEKALQAGKHVMSEKPMAPDVATARRLLDLYRSGPTSRRQVWMVAENWRYESAFVRAAALVAERAIGRPLTCSWSLHLPVSPTNKYYHTEWRRSGEFPGGFLMDGGVHHVAALRLLLGEIERVAAAVKQARADLPPADTLAATLHFANGVVGSYLVTYAASAPWPGGLQVTGDAGSLRVDRGLIELAAGGEVQPIETNGRDGVQGEMSAFAAAVRTNAPHRNTPEQGLRDVAVVEAMLRSAASARWETVAAEL
jgi:predicted dehydrogenase